jgi:HK97 family phage major capsid protein
MPVTTSLRAQLVDVKDRKRAVRDKLAAANDRHRQLRDALGANVDTGSAEARAVRRAEATIGDLEMQLALIDSEERALLASAAGVDGVGVFADSFTRDPETITRLSQMAHSSAAIGRVQLGPWLDRDRTAQLTGRAVRLAGDVVVPDGPRQAPNRGIVPSLQAPLRLLDLLPTQPMEGNSVPYAQEQGDAAGAAAPVVEGAIKPQADVEYVDAEDKTATVAHFAKIRRQTLGDVAGLEDVLRNRLTYGVLAALEAQVIAGDGTGANLTGILNTTGVGSIAYSATELAADQALEGLVAVLLSGAVPNIVALHPRDWAGMLKAKSSGSGDYYSGGPFAATAEALWGTATVPAIGVPQGRAVVGDTRLGCALYVREGVNVIASDSDQDDFVRNRVTLLGEGRWALAIWQPSAFCVVDLAA